MRIERYSARCRDAWDACVDTALNGHLVFYRRFMDYHADRFADHSLLALRKQKIVAVFPANEHDGTLYSHQGLTFGGLVHGEKFYAADVLAFYEQLAEYMRSVQCARLICKPLPFPYTRGACQAQDYALLRSGGRLVERHLSSGVDLAAPLPLSQLRLRGIKKALQTGIHIADSTQYQTFFDMLGKALQRHNATPKHNASELSLLHERFQGDIRLVCAFKDTDMLAAVLLFLTKTAAHTQYICTSPEGMECGALDLLMHTLIDEQRRLKRRWFCFGISTEGDGSVFNTGLMHQKEGFGARGFVHDIYELTIAHHTGKMQQAQAI